MTYCYPFGRCRFNLNSQIHMPVGHFNNTYITQVIIICHPFGRCRFNLNSQIHMPVGHFNNTYITQVIISFLSTPRQKIS